MPIKGPKNKLRVERIRKYHKNQHRTERARRLVKFFKNRNEGAKLAYMITTGQLSYVLTYYDKK